MKPTVIYTERDTTRSIKQSTIPKRDTVMDFSIADMDFMVPWEIREALIHQVTTGVLGYCMIDDVLRRNITQWYKRRYFSQIKEEEMILGPSVNTVLSWCVQAFTEVNDQVIIMPPVYEPFYLAIELNQRRVLEVPLILEKHNYKLDFEAFEQACTKAKVFLLCSPQNPISRVWSHEEISELLAITKKHNVTVISDEIHSDWSFLPFTSASSIDPQVITLLSASKTFNLQSLSTSFIFIKNRQDRIKYLQFINRQLYHHTDGLAYAAIMAAYSTGEDWLNQVKEIVAGNARYLQSYLETSIKQISMFEMQGTYLCWLDMRELCSNDDEVEAYFEKIKVMGISGRHYHSSIPCYRINLATGRQNIVELCRRLHQTKLSERTDK